MRITNHHNLSAPIVKALSRDDYTRGASHRSVTQLIDSPRIRILRERHWDELTEDVSEKMWSVLGTAVHRIFEDHAGDDVISEERLFVEVDGTMMSVAALLRKVARMEEQLEARLQKAGRELIERDRARYVLQFFIFFLYLYMLRGWC